MNGEDKDDIVTLELLGVIEEQDNISQRHLAQRLGVALGLANSYLKRCVRKGLIKIHQAPPNRYLYYLTPSGFAEKSRLTARYLRVSFAFYREAGESCARVFRECKKNGHQCVVLGGASELAEIASIRAADTEIEVIGAYDPSSQKSRFLGRPVWKEFREVPVFDVCVLTDVKDPGATYGHLVFHLGEQKVVVPDMMSQYIRKT